MTGFKDLTLREGAQVPGLDIGDEAGEQVLESLSAFGVERAELAFPRARPREQWFRRAGELGIDTAALARAIPADVDAALAVNPDEVEVIAPASEIQIREALESTPGAVQDSLVEQVKRVVGDGTAAGATMMDAVRADDDFLASFARAAVDAGAKHVTLADTTGAGQPSDVRETVAVVTDAVGGKAGIAIHTHDDMGVAAANAVAGVDAGATTVDATVGGIGERAGNAPIEEVAVLLAERGGDPDLELKELVPACQAVHNVLGVAVPPGKPVLGERAYRHESGMHTAAMLREPATYEPFDPARYGGQRRLLFGEGTGRGAVRALLAGEGREPTDEAVADALEALWAAAAEAGGPLTEAEARELLG